MGDFFKYEINNSDQYKINPYQNPTGDYWDRGNTQDQLYNSKPKTKKTEDDCLFGQISTDETGNGTNILEEYPPFEEGSVGLGTTKVGSSTSTEELVKKNDGFQQLPSNNGELQIEVIEEIKVECETIEANLGENQIGETQSEQGENINQNEQKSLTPYQLVVKSVWKGFWRKTISRFVKNIKFAKNNKECYTAKELKDIPFEELDVNLLNEIKDKFTGANSIRSLFRLKVPKEEKKKPIPESNLTKLNEGEVKQLHEYFVDVILGIQYSQLTYNEKLSEQQRHAYWDLQPYAIEIMQNTNTDLKFSVEIPLHDFTLVSQVSQFNI